MSRLPDNLLPAVASTILLALSGTALAQGKGAAEGPRYGLGRAFLSWRAALGLDPLGRVP